MERCPVFFLKTTTMVMDLVSGTAQGAEAMQAHHPVRPDVTR